MANINPIYSPCLRWKLGEYQALSNLSSEVKNVLYPLIEIPEIGFDFEKWENSKSIENHIEKIPERIEKKWGSQEFFLDALLVDETMLNNGIHPLEWIFKELQERKCNCVPVTGINRSKQYERAIRNILKNQKKRLCFRITLEEAADSALENKLNQYLINKKMSYLDCNLILDLKSPNFEPISGFSKLLLTIINRIPKIESWRNIILLGTSFPSSMAEVQYGQSVIPRFEWNLYVEIVKKMIENKLRIPIFGDYAINHPELLQIDMRKVKPAATLRYTIKDHWLILKGKNVRDNGFDQYRKHCEYIVNSKYFYGERFSYGDFYIAKCAKGSESTGNLSTWRKVGTNHHLKVVFQDLSNFFDLEGISSR